MPIDPNSLGLLIAKLVTIIILLRTVIFKKIIALIILINALRTLNPFILFLQSV